MGSAKNRVLTCLVHGMAAMGTSMGALLAVSSYTGETQCEDPYKSKRRSKGEKARNRKYRSNK